MPTYRDRRRDYPLWIRIILKVPNLSLEGFSDRFQGAFWILILPILLAVFPFANLLLIACLSSPFNMILVAVLDSSIAALLVRILVERTLTSEEAMLNQEPFRWDLERSLNEYLDGNRLKRAPIQTDVHESDQASEKQYKREELEKDNH